MAVTKENILYIFVLTLLIEVAMWGCATSGPSIKWGSQYALPEAELTLQEVERKTYNGMKAVVYRFHVSGVQEGKIFKLWGKKLDSKPSKVVDRGVYVDKSGSLMTQAQAGEIVLPHIIEFTAYGFLKAEPLELGLGDDQNNIVAFTKTVPFPVEAAGEGRCRLWVELGSYSGTLFGVYGEGFEPGEEVNFVSRSENEVINGKLNSGEKGKFATIVFPAVIGKQSGVVSYIAIGQRCNLKVEFEWGPPALKVQ